MKSHYSDPPKHQSSHRHTLSVLVDNEPGVLARIAGLFSGRGYNIESLTVSETEHEKHVSRITIVTTGTPAVITQIIHQLDRMVPVHSVADLTVAGNAVTRELAMVKGNYFAKAGLDLAWWDLHAQLQGKPLWQVIGYRQRRALEAPRQGALELALFEGLFERCAIHADPGATAGRLGMDIGALAPADRHVDGVVDMMLDATGNYFPRLVREMVRFGESAGRLDQVLLRLAEHYEHSLELPNGSKLYAIANRENSARGYTASIVIVDEAAVVADEVIGVATPTLARTNGKLWLLSTPNGETGLFYNIWHDEKLTGWFRMKATIEDCPYASEDFIEEQRRLFPATFRQEFYCEFTPAKGRLLSRARIEAMVDHTLKYEPFPSLSDGLW